MEARCRHRSGRYFGVIPDAVQAPLGAPFRHSLMQRSSAICSAVGGVARSAATLVARWRRTFRRCLRRRAPLGAIVRAGCALRARCRRGLRLRSGGGASGALQGWPLTPFRGRTLRLHFRHRLHRHLGRTAVGGQRHEWRFF